MVDVTSYPTASTTAGTNASINGTSILGTGLVSTADDSFRNSMALAAKFYSDFGGTGTPGGTANAVTYTTPTVYTAYVAGMRIRFTPSAANTAATTLNLDAIGAKAVRKISGGTDVALTGGEFAAGVAVDLVYSTAANSAAGGWIIDKIGNSAFISAGVKTGYGFGCTLSNGTDATNDIDVTSGAWRDSTDVDDMVVAQITKQLDVAWAVGGTAAAPAGGLDQGSIANATYHMHLIKRPDTGVVDAIYSLSHDKSATITVTVASPAVITMGVAGKGHGLPAGAPVKFSTTGALPTGITAGTQYYVIAAGLTETAFEISTSNGGAAVNTTGTQSGVHTGLPGPQLPTSYTLFRRIGSIVRTGAAIKTFVQDGDFFTWLVPVADVNVTNPGTSAVTRTLMLPVGIRTRSRIFVSLEATTGSTNAPANVLISDLSITDSAASGGVANAVLYLASGTIDTAVGVFLEIFTNAAAQIRSRLQTSAAGTTLAISTHGWVDNRGRV